MTKATTKQVLRETLKEAEYLVEQGLSISPGYRDKLVIELGEYASMLEKLLPGEDGAFSEEMRKAVYDVLDPTRDYTPQVMEAEVSAVLSAIVDTLTQAEGRDV